MKDKGMPMKLLWIDLETSGLDPRKDDVLEVAAGFATLERPFGVTADYVRSWVTLNRWSTCVWGTGVREMHQKSGLVDELKTAKLYVSDVEDILLRDVPATEDREEMTVLAGSSVHFDLSFIRCAMPRLGARLSHRVYDVSAVKLFCRSLGMPKLPRADAHRAKADVLESIEHARQCADWLGSPSWARRT
jgi:oligoribonuclease